MRITYIVIERSGLRFNCIENSCKSWFSFDLVRVQCYSILGKNNGKWKIEVNRDRSLNLKRRERERTKNRSEEATIQIGQNITYLSVLIMFLFQYELSKLDWWSLVIFEIWTRHPKDYDSIFACPRIQMTG